MACRQDLQNEDNKFSSLGIKVEGDLGELQVIETSDSDCSDDEKTVTRIQKSGIIDTFTTIPASTIAIEKSSHIQIGNNTYFQGPVTIKQIVKKNGIENASYTADNQNEHNSQDSTNRDNPKQVDPLPMVIMVPPWLKMSLSVTIVLVIGIICVIVLYMQSHSQEENTTNHDSDHAKEPSYYTKVVAVCYDNYFQMLVFSIIVVPITIMLVLYPLLTSQNLDTGVQNNRENGVAAVKIAHYPQGDFNDSIEKHKAKADPLLISPNHLRIVSRTDWLAQPVEGELDKIRQPVPWVVITHTATEGCDYQSECVLRVRLIQMFHIESKKWDDIGYNFLVAGDGSAYFGRGWDYIGAHTLGYNRYSVGIAFIGTFNNETPPKKQIEACQKLIKLGVQLGKIAKDYKLFAHRQLSSTLSPGDKLYDIIKEWPHFVPENTDIEELAPKDY